MKIRRRRPTAWHFEGPVACPVCRHEFPKMEVVDDNGIVDGDYVRQEMEKHKVWYLPVGYHNATCPACGIFLVLQVELIGSYFDKTGMGIQPIVRLWRARVDENNPEKELGEEELELVAQWVLDEVETRIEDRDQTSDVGGQEEEE